jgi:hypothetical protein
VVFCFPTPGTALMLAQRIIAPWTLSLCSAERGCWTPRIYARHFVPTPSARDWTGGQAIHPAVSEPRDDECVFSYSHYVHAANDTHALTCQAYLWANK